MIEEEREEEVWSVTKVAYKSVPNSVPTWMATICQTRPIHSSKRSQPIRQFSHPCKYPY